MSPITLAHNSPLHHIIFLYTYYYYTYTLLALYTFCHISSLLYMTSLHKTHLLRLLLQPPITLLYYTPLYPSHSTSMDYYYYYLIPIINHSLILHHISIYLIITTTIILYYYFYYYHYTPKQPHYYYQLTIIIISYSITPTIITHSIS